MTTMPAEMYKFFTNSKTEMILTLTETAVKYSSAKSEIHNAAICISEESSDYIATIHNVNRFPDAIWRVFFVISFLFASDWRFVHCSGFPSTYLQPQYRALWTHVTCLVLKVWPLPGLNILNASWGIVHFVVGCRLAQTDFVRNCNCFLATIGRDKSTVDGKPVAFHFKHANTRKGHVCPGDSLTSLDSIQSSLRRFTVCTRFSFVFTFWCFVENLYVKYWNSVMFVFSYRKMLFHMNPTYTCTVCTVCMHAYIHTFKHTHIHTYALCVYMCV